MTDGCKARFFHAGKNLHQSGQKDNQLPWCNTAAVPAGAHAPMRAYIQLGDLPNSQQKVLPAASDCCNTLLKALREDKGRKEEQAATLSSSAAREISAAAGVGGTLITTGGHFHL